MPCPEEINSDFICKLKKNFDTGISYLTIKQTKKNKKHAKISFYP